MTKYRVTVEGIDYDMTVSPRHSAGFGYHRHVEPHPDGDEEPTWRFPDEHDHLVAVGQTPTFSQHHHCDERCDRRNAVLTPVS